jgi:putative transcriptional regulator
MDKEMEQFQADLLTSVRQMKSDQKARITKIEMTEAAVARNQLGLSQSAFSKLLGVSVRTLQEWEQGRRKPNGAAQTLLNLAREYPDTLRSYAVNHGSSFIGA